MASDSRLSDPNGPLLDAGNKLFSLPLVCRQPDDDGFFSVPFYANTFGLACVGGSLIYSNVYAFAATLTTNLIGPPGATPPSLAELAVFFADIVTRYVRSVGVRRHNAADVNMVLAGVCPRNACFEAHTLVANHNDQGLVEFAPEVLDLAEGRAHFFGTAVAEAEEQLAMRSDADSAARYRAPLDVVRHFIASQDHPSIGGDVQLGFTMGPSFQRVATLDPTKGQGGGFRLNNIDVSEIGHIGPCVIGGAGYAG